MPAVSGMSFGSELVKLWGFKGCRDIKIHIPYNGIVSITAKFNATDKQMGFFKSLIKEYKLEEIIEEGKEVGK